MVILRWQDRKWQDGEQQNKIPEDRSFMKLYRHTHTIIPVDIGVIMLKDDLVIGLLLSEIPITASNSCFWTVPVSISGCVEIQEVNCSSRLCSGTMNTQKRKVTFQTNSRYIYVSGADWPCYLQFCACDPCFLWILITQMYQSHRQKPDLNAMCVCVHSPRKANVYAVGSSGSNIFPCLIQTHPVVMLMINEH